MNLKKPQLALDSGAAETTDDLRDHPKFKRFTEYVRLFIVKRKKARFSDLNRRFHNGYWLNLAIDELIDAGAIKRGGSVNISEFSVGGREIKPLEKMTKCQFTAGSVKKKADSIYNF